MTYAEFESAARAAGLYQEFSVEDLALAQRNPAAGMQLLQYKKNWHAAQTPEEKAKWNQQANALRTNPGAQMSVPPSLPVNAPTMVSSGSPSDYTFAPRPEYTNQYSDIQNELYNQYTNYGPFNYDHRDDPLYDAYKKAYVREGQRATADTLGQTAAMTGGTPSSYAVTAATQAQNYYNAQLADKIPQLYEQAYNKYLQQFSMLGNKLSMTNEMEQTDYYKYLQDVSQTNVENQMGYQQHTDTLNYNLQKDNMAWKQYTDTLDYNLQRDNMAWNQYTDTLSYGTQQDALAWERAFAAAEIGDYSLLRALGIDTSALQATKVGSGGGGGGGGGGGPLAETPVHETPPPPSEDKSTTSQNGAAILDTYIAQILSQSLPQKTRDDQLYSAIKSANENGLIDDNTALIYLTKYGLLANDAGRQPGQGSWRTPTKSGGGSSR